MRESQRHQTSLPSNSITARAKSLLSAQTDLEDEDSSDAETETICSPRLGWKMRIVNYS